jgi:hypothetical protein
MGCSACGGRKNGQATQYEITYRDGSPSEVVPDLTTVRRKLAVSPQGGTYKLVPKAAA